MVSFNVYRSTASGAYVEGVCLATDEKPITGIANGSILYAVDPTDGSTTRYMFDQSTATWIDAACPCSGGGSGGGGGVSGELPEVTNVDNGDVLTVVDGAWGKAAPISEIAFINLTNDGTGIEASYNDLLALVNANKLVMIWVKNSWRWFLYFLTKVATPGAGEYQATFFNGNSFQEQVFVSTDADDNMVFGT